MARRSAWRQWKRIRPLPGLVWVIWGLVLIWIAIQVLATR